MNNMETICVQNINMNTGIGIIIGGNILIILGVSFGVLCVYWTWFCNTDVIIK